MRFSTERFLIGAVLAVSLLTLGLQAFVLRPRLWPAGAGLSILTLKDQGVDVELANWRGIVAPPELSTEQRDCIAAVLQQMHDSQAWQDVLAKYGWQDYFLAGDEFAQFLPAERDRITGILRDLGLVA